jgi:hypothetical protein
MSAPRTGCPSCAAHEDSGPGIHKTAHEPIRIGEGDFGHLTAYAWQAAGGPPAARPRVTVHAIINGDPAPGALVMLDDPDTARALAEVIGRLALATPAQHRALAAQVRHAAEALDGDPGAWLAPPPQAECPATVDAGMPEGPERCHRGGHADSRHESENLTWWDDYDGGSL